ESASVNPGLVIGEGESPEGLRSLRYAYENAHAAVRALRALGFVRTGADTSQLGVAGLLLSDDRDLDKFVVTQLGPVIDYDQKRNSVLLQTVDAYFRCNRSIQAAAQQLVVHPNTVTQRLDRVTSLLGSDWREPHRSFNIQLALTVNAVLRTIEPR
ncbi:MAG: helix-turn-helix domain-containing protein, partial [Leucobacter sp.]|nr:helix-turn-helix domain-containing protein [Leucobacter sp.]